MLKNIFRPSILPGLLALGFCAIFLFVVKHKVQTLHRELSNINNQVIAEKEALHVLKAEWAYLTRAQRIKNLAEKNLKLQPLQPKQIITVNLNQGSNR